MRGASKIPSRRWSGRLAPNTVDVGEGGGRSGQMGYHDPSARRPDDRTPVQGGVRSGEAEHLGLSPACDGSDCRLDLRQKATDALDGLLGR